MPEKKEFDIKPWRMANLVKAVPKIYDMMIRADVGVSFTECLFMLDCLRDMVLRAMEERAKND